MFIVNKPLSYVMVKPAGPDCNMRCRYCFYLEKSELFADEKIHRMSDKILEELIRQVMAQGTTRVTFGWQGGNPR